ncbi:Putative ATP-dependent helicase IRC3 [Malassezia psittaci]|uniref:ATP-dependent helicase IRC3 n=1 Tax=Malassezia psittaci TaxID=1821823 RepID=A0AAF0JEQ9_9BASI|nr:Putative ATP-dependent helicase IRC3 [Malassezia psittaci]
MRQLCSTRTRHAHTQGLEVKVQDVPNCPEIPRSTISLRPYQAECVDTCLLALKRGVERIGVSSPTGSGKTIMFTDLLARVPAGPGGAQQVLILVNAVGLAEQAFTTVKRVFPHLNVEIDQGQKRMASGTADVTVATVQTIHRPNRLANYIPSRFKCVIVDEAHHATSSTYRKVLSHFNTGVVSDEASDSQPTKIPIIGFSATFSRHDGIALSRVFEEIVYHKDFMAMMEENCTSNDFNVGSLAKVINDPSINELVVRAWIQRAHGRRRSTLVFAVNIEHIKALQAEFQARGIEARGIHSGLPMAERNQVLDEFRQGKFPVLINCAILTEGTDIPPVDCVLLARPTQSQNLFSQMIGRGMRLSPETAKQDCLILDLVGNLSNNIVCTPTLFGLSELDAIEGMYELLQETYTDETVESLCAKAEKAKEAGSDAPNQQMEASFATPWQPTGFSFIDFDSTQQLYEAMQSRTILSLRKISPNAWVDCGEDTYVLSGWDSSYIKLTKADSEFIGTFYPRSNPDHLIGIEFHPSYWRKKQILKSEDFQHAIRGCDTFMTKLAKEADRSPIWLRRDAQWRRKPATAKSIEFLKHKLANNFPERSSEQDTPPWTGATQGAVHTSLTRLLHGGKARWRRAARKHNEKLIKSQQKSKRSEVRVGRLSDY